MAHGAPAASRPASSSAAPGRTRIPSVSAISSSRIRRWAAARWCSGSSPAITAAAGTPWKPRSRTGSTPYSAHQVSQLRSTAGIESMRVPSMSKSTASKRRPARGEVPGDDIREAYGGGHGPSCRGVGAPRPGERHGRRRGAHRRVDAGRRPATRGLRPDPRLDQHAGLDRYAAPRRHDHRPRHHRPGPPRHRLGARRRRHGRGGGGCSRSPAWRRSGRRPCPSRPGSSPRPPMSPPPGSRSPSWRRGPGSQPSHDAAPPLRPRAGRAASVVLGLAVLTLPLAMATGWSRFGPAREAGRGGAGALAGARRGRGLVCRGP